MEYYNPEAQSYQHQHQHNDQGHNQHLPSVLCCVCGVGIQPNPASMCGPCLKNNVDITEGIPKQGVLYYCRGCTRYLQPPDNWVRCELESRELLSLCLKRLKGLGKLRLVDAGFIWTEPHSRRVKVKVVVQKELFVSAVIQHEFVVEYYVSHKLCDECHRVAASDFWDTVLQVRQKVQHKRTFLHLEQLILKAGAHEKTVNIKEKHEGLDFFFAAKNQAVKLLEFLQTIVPVRYQTSQRLISHDVHSNSFNYKSTYSVEIPPVCQYDLVCLPPKLAKSLGNIDQLVVCTKIGPHMHFMDVRTLRTCHISAEVYWRYEFRALSTTDKTTKYVVMDVDYLDTRKGKYQLADVQLIRESEYGITDNYIHCRTHMGQQVRVGTAVIGYDVKTLNTNDENFDKYNDDHKPYVVLIRRSYNRAKTGPQRKWQLQRLAMENADEAADTKRLVGRREQDYETFLQGIEEDPESRVAYNLYRTQQFEEAAAAAAAAGVSLEQIGRQMGRQMGVDDTMGDNHNDEDEDEDELVPQPALDELLNALSLEEQTIMPGAAAFDDLDLADGFLAQHQEHGNDDE